MTKTCKWERVIAEKSGTLPCGEILGKGAEYFKTQCGDYTINDPEGTFCQFCGGKREGVD